MMIEPACISIPLGKGLELVTASIIAVGEGVLGICADKLLAVRVAVAKHKFSKRDV
jgi:hypothetical protein